MNHHDHHHSGHSHDHARGRGHPHAPASFDRAFAIGIALNGGFVLIETLYGFASNSMALIADAGHNLSDVLGLILAWIAHTLARRPASKTYTYGLRGGTILAALANAGLLFAAIGVIAWESAQRLLDPQPIASLTVIVVAAVGIVVNGATAWLFASGRKDDLNIRGAYLHMAADAAISAGVVAAGFAILWTGLSWIDPLVSLAIVAAIGWGTLGLARESLAMSLSAVPRGIDIDAVRAFLESRAGVAGVHDLHVWSVSTTETALTAHLVMPAGPPGDDFIFATARELRLHHGVGHATIQVEADGARCPMRADAPS